ECRLMSPRGLVRSLQKTPITRLSIQVKKVIDKMDHMSSLFLVESLNQSLAHRSSTSKIESHNTAKQ
ncbi:hypothetical protein BLOT_014292, partial [Blomia tropicalis]